MSEEERPHYARLYRKGKPVGKIFEANALSEFRRKKEREEAQEEVRLLKGFNYWWHVNVRLNWLSVRSFITGLSAGQWTAIGTVGLVTVGALQYRHMTNADSRSTDTQQGQEKLERRDPPSLEVDPTNGDTSQATSKDTATSKVDSTMTKDSQSPREKKKSDGG